MNKWTLTLSKVDVSTQITRKQICCHTTQWPLFFITWFIWKKHHFKVSEETQMITSNSQKGIAKQTKIRNTFVSGRCVQKPLSIPASQDKTSWDLRVPPGAAHVRMDSFLSMFLHQLCRDRLLPCHPPAQPHVLLNNEKHAKLQLSSICSLTWFWGMWAAFRTQLLPSACFSGLKQRPKPWHTSFYNKRYNNMQGIVGKTKITLRHDELQ